MLNINKDDVSVVINLKMFCDVFEKLYQHCNILLNKCKYLLLCCTCFQYTCIMGTKRAQGQSNISPVVGVEGFENRNKIANFTPLDK